MKKKHILIISVFAILFLLAFAVFRGLTTREIILKKNGIPLANLKGELYPSSGEAELMSVSTDLSGKLTIDALSERTTSIAITLYEGNNICFNGDIFLPEFGSSTFDFQGNRTVSTTIKTYADFGIFKYTTREVMDWTLKNTSAKPDSKPPEEEPKNPQSTEPPSSTSEQ